MHGWGQWYALAAAAVVAGCYLSGRHRRTWAVIALLSALEVAAAVAVSQTQDTVSWLIDQAVVVLAVFAALTGAYRRLRHEFVEQGWAHARDARLHERARIAADLHDTLGHDLALLSLQAAGIQVTAADPETRERAAAVRAGSAAAIETVRRIVDLLDVEADTDVATVLDRARQAGMTLRTTGAAPRERFVARLVAEALSNAVRHAPGAPVTVTFAGRRVEIVNPVPPDAVAARSGTGLAMLSARLEQAGGALTAGPVDGLFRLVADVPPGLDGDGARWGAGLGADYLSRRRRVRRMLAGTVLIPFAVLLVVATGFYVWAVRDAAMEDRVFAGLRVGMPQAAAERVLPGREAPIRFGGPSRPGCRYYTDGNYPLAYGNYVVCFAQNRVSRLQDLTGRDE
ncbi:sensor histidine kinase [Actinoplanes sp. DH11]|uniref:sensor histidine kinase n=1 Tax=Actinoplanes sp. DH11 TaxID=2857011 RepID=UPI001E3BB497|nr:histidine kinase [Actinoplanes sp. DH11]